MDAGNLQHIGERLRGERARLGLSQVVFADACGVNRSTLASWEKGEQSPTAGVLSTMAGLGVDVLYVVTGERAPLSSGALSQEERQLVASYKQGDALARQALESVAAMAARSSSPSSGGNAVTIGGDVGQQVNGDQTITAPMSIRVGSKAKK
jgi:transcriptional regulator with XRE-family HTH domain